MRTVADHAGQVEVVQQGFAPILLRFAARPGWQELSAELKPSGRPSFEVEMSLVTPGDWVDHHVWLLQTP